MVEIDTVYQKVLALLNKEQRGYMTPQEFNLLADKAQIDIFESYFHDLKMAYHKPIKNQHIHTDEIEMIEEKLHPFIEQISASTSGNQITLSGNCYKLINVSRVDGNADFEFGSEVEGVSKRELQHIMGNPLTMPTVSRSIYYRRDGNGQSIIEIYPEPDALEQFVYTFYRQPNEVEWAYVVVAGKALYNANQTINFELHQSEEETLVTRILELAGVVIMKPGIVEVAKADKMATKAEQNN